MIFKFKLFKLNSMLSKMNVQTVMATILKLNFLVGNNKKINKIFKPGYFIEPWRKTKTKGDSCFMDGKQWWWCPKHKRVNNFDGLYVTHQPGPGDKQWLEKRCRNKRKCTGGNNNSNTSTAPTGSTSEGPQLVLNDQMRQALLTHHGFNKIQTQAITDVTNQQGN